FGEAKSGVYCGPLKLLAAEVFKRSNELGIKCDLVTGEERRYAVDNFHPSAHLSSTVEMLSTQMRVEVHLCGESAAIEIVKKLLDPIGEHVEVRYYERKTPLTIANQGLGSLDHLEYVNYYVKRAAVFSELSLKVQSGDCIVCFSRKAIYNVTKSLEKLGVKPAVIYGDLPPGTKLAQAAKFNDPNDPCNVLVATDAIGMGLNLNIRRIIFSGCTRQGELLPNYSALQIAGRAGRFGTTYSDGIATTLRNEDIGTLKDILSQPVEPIETVGIAPTFEQIETFSFHLPQASFVHLLDLFVSVCSISDQFFICTVEQMRTLADLIDYIPLPLKVRYTFCISPINVESKLTAAAFVKMVRRFSSGQCLTYDWMMDMLNWESIGQPENLQQLEHLEKALCNLRNELAVREACKQLDAILQESVENILEILENSAMGDARKGSILKKMRERAQTQREKEEYEAEKKKEMKLPGKRKGMRK
ncbi:helicase protein, partial [Necator americanus]